MRLKAKVTFKQYLRLLYSLAYEKPVLRLLVAFAFLLLIWIILSWLDLFNLPEPLIYQYITLILILVVQPFMIFYTIYRNYQSSNHLRETLDMRLTDTRIKIRGESFYMEILWPRIFKIVERKRWFLIYQNNLSAIIIPKRGLDESEINEVREILKGVEGVPLQLNS
ncbi:YcxB family protein [Chryseobacterium sp.]|uniref:YcxB family protein n=1 Tax=Chryseobacterium sp. TaxID=1871047 RepID=UPI0011CA9B7D|nr:YcxB family protein [Chryseobacterium sp.]TXF74939.1 YcxB family protein [Chryseobacterium sp.]